MTAGNYNTGAPGSNTGNLGVTFTAASAGALAPLTGQVLNLSSNFDNIADQKLNIVLGSGAAAYNAAVGSATSPVQVANQRIGGSNSSTVAVANTATAGSFSEDLNVSIGGTSGVTGSGSINGRLAGTSNTGSGAITVGVNTSSAGAKTGTVTLDYQTAGAVGGVSNGLGTASVGSQNVTVNGNVYQVAQASLPTSVDLGKFHVGAGMPASVSQAITVGNTLMAPVGFQEGLDVTANGTSGQATISGVPITNLAAGDTSNAIIVGLTGLSAGVNAGSATLALASNGTISGLTTLGQGDANISVTGTGYNLAQSNVIDPVHIVAHVGDGGGLISQALTITNTAPAGIYSEGLNSSFGSFTAGGGDTLTPTFTGSINNLAAGATDSSSMLAKISTVTAGLFNGSVVVDQASNGTISGLANTALQSQYVGVSGSVTGGVFSYAEPTVNNAPIDFGNVRINDMVANRSISISNTAPNASTTELLNGSFVSAPSGFNGSGSFTGLAPGAIPNMDILVGLDTSVAGAKTGNVAVNFVSDGTTIAGDGTSHEPRHYSCRGSG